jgi:hypothetical protein
MAHELMHALKSKQGRGGLMAVKIDMKQAFDRMEWSFFIIHYGQTGISPHLGLLD